MNITKKQLLKFLNKIKEVKKLVFQVVLPNKDGNLPLCTITLSDYNGRKGFVFRPVGFNGQIQPYYEIIENMEAFADFIHSFLEEHEGRYEYFYKHTLHQEVKQNRLKLVFPRDSKCLVQPYLL